MITPNQPSKKRNKAGMILLLAATVLLSACATTSTFSQVLEPVSQIEEQSNFQPPSSENPIIPTNAGEASPGYTLYAPLGSTSTYLIDLEGQVVHTWESHGKPGNAVYLLDNGHLLRTISRRSKTFDGGGIGGRVEEYTWDGDLVWSFTYADQNVHLHHDVEMLPNGNVLMIAWERKTLEEALALGFDRSLLKESDELWFDHIIEVDPDTNEIVWEWHTWDHLIQDQDPTKTNYGELAQNPGKIDLNYSQGRDSDQHHINSIDYNPELDQILVSVRVFNEVWVIDHSTTTEEAALNTGGNSGKGGEILYRWGNPQAYGAGSQADQTLFGQHDAKWIEPGYPGEGNILIFNNGNQRQRPTSSVVEITPPLNPDGSYEYTGVAYGPDTLTWEYTAENPEDFFAQRISSAQRLPNGNTLICDGPKGYFFEVTPAGEIVWEYTNPEAITTPNGAMNEVFRAERYGLNDPGLAGHDLTSKGFLGSAQSGDQNQSDDIETGRPRLDLVSAAEQLGVTETALREALGEPGQGPPDLRAAAASLGVSVADLIDALGLPKGGQPPNNRP
jgi:hypothetical protein